MRLVNGSLYEGMPPRLYRTPGEIRSDIFDVKQRIDSLNSRLNSRNIIGELRAGCAEGEAEKWLPKFKSIVEDAEDALEALRELGDTLDGLREELRETEWILKSC